MNSRFDAELLAECKTLPKKRRIELRFADSAGRMFVLSLPLSVAIALGTLIYDVSTNAPFVMGEPGGGSANKGGKTGRQDDERINVDQEHELGYWAEKLGVSREQLRKAVQVAGPMVKDVQRHLGR
jgi:hypothetical protein